MGNRITIWISPETEIKPLPTEKERTKKVIEYCELLIDGNGCIYLQDMPYTKDSLPEFIHDIGTLCSFELAEVYNKYKTTIRELQEQRLNILNFLDKPQGIN